MRYDPGAVPRARVSPTAAARKGGNRGGRRESHSGFASPEMPCRESLAACIINELLVGHHGETEGENAGSISDIKQAGKGTGGSKLSQCNAKELLPGVLWGSARLWPGIASNRYAALLFVPSAVTNTCSLPSPPADAAKQDADGGSREIPVPCDIVAAASIAIDAAARLLPSAGPVELSAAAWAVMELVTGDGPSATRGGGTPKPLDGGGGRFSPAHPMQQTAASGGGRAPPPTQLLASALAFGAALSACVVTVAAAAASAGGTGFGGLTFGPQALATAAHCLSSLAYRDVAALEAVMSLAKQLESETEAAASGGTGLVMPGSSSAAAAGLQPRDAAMIAAALARLRCPGLPALLRTLGRRQLETSASTTNRQALMNLALAHAVAGARERWMLRLVVSELVAAEESEQHAPGKPPLMRRVDALQVFHYLVAMEDLGELPLPPELASPLPASSSMAATVDSHDPTAQQQEAKEGGARQIRRQSAVSCDATASGGLSMEQAMSAGMAVSEPHDGHVEQGSALPRASSTSTAEDPLDTMVRSASFRSAWLRCRAVWTGEWAAPTAVAATGGSQAVSISSNDGPEALMQRFPPASDAASRGAVPEGEPLGGGRSGEVAGSASFLQRDVLRIVTGLVAAATREGDDEARSSEEEPLTGGQLQIAFRRLFDGASVSSEHRTDDGLFSIDIAVVLRASGDANNPRQRMLAIEVDGPTHYTLNKGGGERCLLGGSLLRNRGLERRGWAVVGVPWFCWDSLGSDEDKARYLERTLVERALAAFEGAKLTVLPLE